MLPERSVIDPGAMVLVVMDERTSIPVIEGLAAWELEHVATINTYEQKADVPEAEASDLRWKQAEEVVAALKGMSQQKLADNWKRADGTTYHQTHVSLVARTYRTFQDLSLSDRPRWNEAYNSDAVRKKSTPAKPSTEPTPAPEGTFGTIVADPPWRYGNTSTRGAAEDHYDTMSIEEICALGTEGPAIAERAAPASHLYLWTTAGHLPDAFQVVEAWGFEYKTYLVWVKPQMGMGNYFRVSTELVLFGVRGGLRTNDQGTMNWFEAPRSKHSSKPATFTDLVEKSSPGPYLELFARCYRDERLEGTCPCVRCQRGWSVWGDQT